MKRFLRVAYKNQDKNDEEFSGIVAVSVQFEAAYRFANKPTMLSVALRWQSNVDVYRLFAPGDTNAWTECGCLFFFGAFLIRIAASCAKRDFSVFSKRSWIKISRESVLASTSTFFTGDSSFAFFLPSFRFFSFLWNLTNENRSAVFVVDGTARLTIAFVEQPA